MYNGGAPNNAKEFFSNYRKKYGFFLIEDACHELGGNILIKTIIK